MSFENSGYIQLTEYDAIGGNSWDSKHYARAYRNDRPYDFGTQVSKMFSASDKFKHKVITYLTMGSGRYKEIPNDRFTWTLFGDDEVPFIVPEVPVDTSNLARPGFGNTEFEIALSEGWLSEPDVILLEDNRLPMLEIVGSPRKVGSVFYYTVRLQDSNPNSFIPLTAIAIGSRVFKVSTSVATEMNYKFGTQQFETGMQLESQIGAFAEKFSVTDKVIRNELRAAAKQGRSSMFTSGYAFDIKNSKGEIVPRGAFFSKAEAMLLDQVEMDREVQCVFGRSTTQTNEQGYLKRTGPGFRQLALDGHTLFHNGNLTAQNIEDYFHGIFLTRVNSEMRDVVIDTGEAGMRLFHNILASEARSFLTIDTHYIGAAGYNPGGVKNPLRFGAQFVEFESINGIRVRLKYNPMKDDHKYCSRTHPMYPQYTIDSFRMDVYDLGMSGDDYNFQMLVEEGVESYSYTGGVVTPGKGPEKAGAMVPSLEKGVTVEREMSGGLWVKDVSRIGSIIFEPEE